MTTRMIEKYSFPPSKMPSPNLNCITYPDAETALIKIANKTIIADIIFLDLNMPRVNGVEFLKQLNGVDIPVIVYSTSSYIEASIVNLPEVKGYLIKPDLYSDLIKSLKCVLEVY